MTNISSIALVALGAVIAIGAQSLVGEYSAREPAAQNAQEASPIVSMPRVGEVRDGWRYMGGDPSKKASWRPANAPPDLGTIMDGWRYIGGDPSKKENWQPVN